MRDLNTMCKLQNEANVSITMLWRLAVVNGGRTMSSHHEDRNRLRLKAGTTYVQDQRHRKVCSKDGCLTSDSSLFDVDAFAPEGTDVRTGCGREGSITPVGHLRDDATRNSCSFM